MNIVCLRPFNIYGPRQNDAYAGVISKFFDRLKNNKRPIIYGDGKQTRDFIHVSDIAMAFFLSIKYNKKKFDVFNLATEKSTSILKLANLFAEIMNKSEIKSIHKNEIPGVVKRNSTTNKKLRSILGLTPQIDLKYGLSTLIEEKF
jgi:UDP-glucose 4-epimerase